MSTTQSELHHETPVAEPQVQVLANPDASSVAECPVLAPGVELVGEMQETGFAESQWLVERDGRFVQVTELLYRVLEQINGERTLAEIAAGMTESTDWAVTEENIRQIIQTKLIPMGLVADADGTVVARPEERSALQINMRKRVISPEIIDPIARVLQVLFAPPVLVPMLIVVAVAHVWLYFVRGVADSIQAALYTPGGLLLVLGVVIASGVFHEFGHAAGLRYGGGRVRGMGVGLYLVYPTFYSDTSEAYRLGRVAKLRTDLGGVYFHLIFSLAIMGLYFVTGQEVLLAVVLVINGDVLYQLVPFFRLDGYWALASITGIPDPLSQVGPFLRSVFRVPGLAGSKLPNLRPWVKAVFSLYIILTIPTLALLFLIFFVGIPTFLPISFDSLLYQIRLFGQAQSAGDLLVMTAVASQIALLTLSLLAVVYLVYSVFRKPVVALLKWSRPTPARRVAGGATALAAIALIAFLWAPAFVSAPVPEGVQEFSVEDRNHVQTRIAYPQTPPVGGDHAPIWQNCGFYEAPIASENAVHSMEHGAVWITYRPNLPQEQVEALRLMAQSQDYLLVSPFPDLPAPVVASAWGRQLLLESVNDPRLDQFVRAFQLGAQAPERGGPCDNGIGEPK